eukprot:5299492-Amphidinium_carterae.1
MGEVLRLNCVSTIDPRDKYIMKLFLLLVSRQIAEHSNPLAILTSLLPYYSPNKEYMTVLQLVIHLPSAIIGLLRFNGLGYVITIPLAIITGSPCTNGP